MKVIVNNSSLLSNIQTIALYKLIKYVPAEENMNELERNNHVADKVLYLSSNDRFSGYDDIEYDFSFLIEKHKYNDNQKLENLDPISKVILGKELEDLVLAEKMIVPSNTIPDEGITDKISYFSSSIVSNNKFIILNIEKDIYKIELYEGVIDSNNSEGDFIDYDTGEATKKPISTIILGLEKKDNLNESVKYESDKSNFNKTLWEENKVEYMKLLDEIRGNKFICISLSEEGSDNLKVNLAYDSWLKDSKNPLRNLNKYLLRNDDFYFILNNTNPVKEVGNYLIDSNTGTVLSNTLTPIELSGKTSILEMKRKRILEDSLVWNNSVNYSQGDIVECNGVRYESLKKNNIDNFPPLSSAWEVESELTSYFTTRITVRAEEGYGCSIFPSGIITILPTVDFVEFSIVDEPGYEIDKNEIDIYPIITDKKGNKRSKFYLKTTNEAGETTGDYSYFKSQDKGHIIIFEDPESLEYLRNITSMYFKHTKPTFQLVFSIIDESETHIPWSSFIKDVTLEITRDSEVIGEDEIINNSIPVTVGQKISIGMEENSKYAFLGDTIKINIQPDTENDATGKIYQTLQVISKTIKITVGGDAMGDFTIENTELMTEYNGSAVVRFYPNEEIVGFDENNYILSINGVDYSLTPPLKKSKNTTDLSYEITDNIYTLSCSSIKENLEINLKYKK